jgi:Cu/Zn superoxide dismutase
MKKYLQNSIYLIVLLVILLVLTYYIINNLIGSMGEGAAEAVAVFKTDTIEGEVVVSDHRDGIKLKADFTKLPPGKHGFHIHKAGDLRGEGCAGLCEHYDIGNNSHGGEPNSTKERHTGDLGNIELKNGKFSKTYYIKGPSVKDLWGRSIIVHEGEDDLGKGHFEDSKVTGHSGKRIGCAIFGRVLCNKQTNRNKTRKNK